MGLINQAVTIQKASQDSEEGKKKNGLLERISRPSSYEQVKDSFLNILSTARSEKGFILIPVEDKLSVIFQRGIDFTSCIRMIPQQFSFAQMCPKNDWNYFSASQLDMFSSYFSTRERASLVMVAVHPITINEKIGYILLIQSQLTIDRNKIDTEAVLPLLEDFVFTLNKNHSLLSALSICNNLLSNSAADSEKMISAFEEKRFASLFSISFTHVFPDFEIIETDFDFFSLYRAMVAMIVKQAGPAGIVRKTKDYSLRMVLFTVSETEYNLYINQMKKPLEKLFGLPRIKKLEIEYKGTTRSSNSVLSFLTGEQ